MNALLIALLFATSASAGLPLPAYPDCGPDLSTCPQEAAGNWTFWGHTPPEMVDQIRPEEVPFGIGNAVLPAFHLGTGRWQRMIAIADSGIDWREPDLWLKVHLQVGELPLPQRADGTVGTDHDLNGDGIVNLADYQDDPRVRIDAGVDLADDVLDPSDLIHTFSDGVDDDGDGYIDDIAGWDFFEGDNDPWATNLGSYGDHGTGVMRSAAGEGENGGDIGVCPNCALLPIRIGDSFITTGAIATDGIEFALKSGASVVGMALGVMSNPPELKEVMASAWERGALIVVAAGDEDSFHRNGPAANKDNLVAYALGADNRNWEMATSFLRFVNCDNYGPRIDLGAVTRTSCATGAVASIAGAAGLLFSLGDDLLDQPLSPGEVFQLLTQNAVDVDVPESRGPNPDPELYPSRPGWDSQFGHGRVSVGAAAQAIVDGRIPPVAALDSPEWFDVIPRHWVGDDGVEHGGADDFAVAGRISARGPWTATIEWGEGADPESWTELGTRQGDGPFDGELLRVPIRRWSETLLSEASGCNAPTTETTTFHDDLPPSFAERVRYDAAPLQMGDGVLGRLRKLDGYGISVRLTVHQGDTVATARRHLFLRQDDRLLPGFPVHVASSFETSPTLFDVTGDGVFEVAVAESGGLVHLLDGRGRDLPGWPVSTGARQRASWPAAGVENIAGTVAVGDIDGGEAEVVAATLDGSLWAWRADGSVVDGFPVSMDYSACDPADRGEDVRTDCGFFAAPTLADLDGDGLLDILEPGMDQQLYAWDGAGVPLPGYPVLVQGADYADRVNRILSSPAVGDVDGDGTPDIVLGTSQTAGSQFGGYGLLYILHADGSVREGWPLPLFAGFAGALPYVGEGVVVSPILADLDGDGNLEIFANATADQGAIYNHDGSVWTDFRATRESFGPESNSSEQASLFMVGNAAMGDLDGDGVLDLFAGGSGIGYGGAILARHDLYNYDHLLLGYSMVREEGDRSSPLPGFPRQMNDISFFGSPSVGDVDGDGDQEVLFGTGHTLRTFDAHGQEPLPPLFHGGWQISTPVLGDIDGDGLRDVLVTTREGLLFAWRTDAPADTPATWPQWGHDAQHSGNVATALPRQAGPALPTPEEAGGCQGGAAGVWPLLILGGWRRKRGRASPRAG